MGNVVFGKQTGSAPAKVVEAEVVNNNLPAVRNQSSMDMASPRPITFRDIVFPRLNLVHGVGQLKDTFTQGAIVFGQSMEIYTPATMDPKTHTVKAPATAPLVMTVLNVFPTRFAERLPGGVRGRLFNTEQEVVNVGGTLDWKLWQANPGMAYFELLADVLVAIQRPEHLADDDTVFTFPVEDKKYALALWALKASAYNSLLKRIWFQAAALGCLKPTQPGQGPNWPAFSWNVSTFLNTKFTNPTWVPMALPRTKSTPAFINFVKDLFNQYATPSDTEAPAPQEAPAQEAQQAPKAAEPTEANG